MTFRDDHDAALARAEALERELDDAKEQLAESESRRAHAEAERDRVKEETAGLRLPQPGETSDERLGREQHNQMVRDALPGPHHGPRTREGKQLFYTCVAIAALVVIVALANLVVDR